MAEIGIGLDDIRGQALARVADESMRREARTRQEAAERDREAREWRRSANRLERYLDDRADADRRREQDDQRSQAMVDAEERRQIQVRFDSLLTDAFGERAPAPAADDDPQAYRRRLMRGLRDRLGEDDIRPVSSGSPTRIRDLAALRINSTLQGPALDIIERDLASAARVQGEKPAWSTLPPEGFIERTRVDDMGHKRTEFLGRSSFIAEMKPPVRHVRAFVDLANRMAMVPIRGGTYRSERLD
jgi:hypothetical protein